jgi:hypothetical protein
MEPNLPPARLKGIGAHREFKVRGKKMKKKLFIAAAMGFLASSLVSVAPASADSLCNNGTYSSNSGRGTCSWNGGVNKSFPSYSDPGSSSYNRNNGLGSTSTWGTTPSRNNGLGSTSKWGNTLNSKRSCSGWRC